MDKRWIGFVMFVLWWGAAPEVHGRYQHLTEPASLSLDVVAKTYTTPEALADFLHQTMTLKTDEELFGTADYWQKPEEFLARRAGDCEDYALFAQAILKRQGIEAQVLSLYGRDGYAHTVCVFARGGRYNVINQDRVCYYQANTLTALAQRIHNDWSYGALAEVAGTRGKPILRITNPNPPSHFASFDSSFEFP